jgi:ectoine hydroxylase-related dioxygenase (phytanoyl-CoA dioxygenase family)
VAGVQDMLTSWVPLMDIPVSLGGLAVRPGGQLRPPALLPRVLSPGQRGWATTDYRPGDVIVFHCLTPHAALPNSTGLLRLSGDFRWQRAEQPAPAEMVLGPGQRHELFSLLFRWRRWWEPVPAGLTLVPRGQLIAAPPGPSQLFGVHPGWRRYKPPRDEVH